ncbi:Aste57867_19633 [Aphanomyces stellatus]|uniref:Aste57867_19633 protein n=1 Tax=Aphanomyces stellatus TaxID=120398 RepID=A0A485LEK0_9STRA|nr:hypothetical protein As57867_019568 [Aphanomyces stellatus]VFT96333.1 Aste57867_19633 [Aphanomyces stellatus]
MGDSVFNLAGLVSEINIGPSAYFPPSASSGARPHDATTSTKRRDAMLSIAEHDEWGLTEADVDADLDGALSQIRARKATSIEQLVARLRATQEVHVAFLVDTTGSMEPQMAAVKDQIRAIAATFTHQGLGVHVAFVGYKDHFDGVDHFQVFAFSPDIAAFERFVVAIPADGGGDGPEDVLGGLDAAATRLQWDPRCTNVLFHIGDAPPHGLEFSGVNGGDSFPKGHPKDKSPTELFAKLEALNVRYHFGRLNSWTDAMLALFDAASTVPLTVFEALDPIVLRTSVVASTLQTVTCNRDKALLVRGTMRQLTFVGLDQPPPDWPTQPTQTGNVVRRVYSATATVAQLLEPKAFELRLRTSRFRVAPHPFAHGCERATFLAQELRVPVAKPVAAPARTSHWLSRFGMAKAAAPAPPATWVAMVAKRFRHVLTSTSEEGRFMQAMECQTLAAALATVFNAAVGHPDMLTFLDTHVVHFPTEFVAVELFLDKFVRFTNNNGWVCDDVTTDEAVQHAVAFSHWTHATTKGYLMVVDLQGARTDDGRLQLTDPAIHCRDSERFTGGTNFGEHGMDLFFESHRCNAVCRKLNLVSSPVTQL